MLEEFLSNVNKDDSGCWLWLGTLGSHGYGLFRSKLAHRIAWEFKNGPMQKGLYACHKCDVRRCVNPDHIFAGTQKENMQDALKKGRTRHGENSDYSDERHPTARLTNEQVVEIRQCSASTYALARKFGVSRQTIGNARRRKTYWDVK